MNPINLHQIAVDAMRSRGLLPAFAPQALQEAEDARQASLERNSAIRDLRHLTWFSIDNDDTRDLDQLSVAEALPDGAARLLVAVADVDTKVAPGSAVDRHAGTNTTSVYTAAGVFPMLPETLSNDLTSLHQDQERLAVVVDMQVEADGTVSGSSVYRGWVLNRAKLTYDGVSAWLDGTAPAPLQLASVDGLEDQLRLHDTLASQLRQWRQTRGALNVNPASARPVFEDGQLVDLRPDVKNRAMDLIADLMIAANSATARYLVDQGFPSLRRLLQAPRRWDRIVLLAASHGVQLPALPDALALDRFLNARRLADPAGFADLSLAVVKLLGSGEYAAAPAAAATLGVGPASATRGAGCEAAAAAAAALATGEDIARAAAAAGDCGGWTGITVIPAPGVALDTVAGSIATGSGKSSRWRAPPEDRMTWSTSMASITASPTGVWPMP